ncbi:MAG: leucyl aminopeptidase [Nitrospinaceae bacterium]
MIRTQIKSENPLTHKTDCLILFWPEQKPAGLLQAIDKKFKGAVAAQFKAKRFAGKKNQTCLLDARGAISPAHVLIAGTGPLADLTPEILRQAAGTAARIVEKARLGSVALHLPVAEYKAACGGDVIADAETAWQAVVEGSHLALYHFDEYKSGPGKNDDDAPSRVQRITVLSPPRAASTQLKRAVGDAVKLVEAVYATRDLMWHPGNRATPAFLAKTARQLARRFQFSCKVLNRKDMEKLNMGALLGVAQGSQEPPAFLVMEHRGGRKKQAPIVIVGKGITFDTGGISLKPGAGMDEMKYDMSGGAVTIGALTAAASLNLPVHVVGLVPAAENMPSGAAIKPGDILTAANGKTIEVLNTDAEGRLVLADALVYAQRFKPRAVIDLATLTGACIVALGHVTAAIIGTDRDLVERLRAAGDVSGERLWELPLYEEFEKAVKSDVADLKNIAGSSTGGGTIVGAAFLKAFVGDHPWAHLDIAGTAWSGEEKPYAPKGGTGFGVRLLVDYLRAL